MVTNLNVTEDALWVLTLAQLMAERDGRHGATPTDLLLGLMLVGEDNPGGYLLRATCQHPGQLPSPKDVETFELPDHPSFEGEWTPLATQVIQNAFDVALDLGTPFVSSIHLLVSVLSRKYDEESASRIADAGLSETKVLRRWLAYALRDRWDDPGSGGSPIGMV